MTTAEKVSAFRLGLFRLARLLRRQRLDLPISHTEFNIMALLGRRQRVLPSEIATEEKISAQAISQNLNALENQGLIIRTTDPADRRRALISLSEQGRELLDQIKHDRDAWLLAAMHERLDAAERDQLLAVWPLLQKLTTNE
ncbi:hypothetical protein C7T94_06890 [Pedobacter yulinensis]|uniref:HTH marR-type domain-containing protein n=1 Tax=Pedobacter yulinensis TaxID=2126353 RepID=A0A2T3HPP4_9SPHI|nr:MarR family transcriptional regulator [Pedobacter yulinensis]PST84425.1 hypothetical protein C7T94_06890 [Pedobacter yulinensis]